MSDSGARQPDGGGGDPAPPDETAAKDPPSPTAAPAAAPGRRWTIPLHVNILTIFVITLIVVVGVVVVHSHIRNRDAALQAAATLMDATSAVVRDRLREIYDPAYAIVAAVSQLPGAAVKPDLATHPLDPALLLLLERRPFISSVFLGFSDGDFYRLVRYDASDPRPPQVPQSALYGLQKLRARPDGSRYALWQYLDDVRRPAGSHVNPNARFDPRQRPWFRDAFAVAEPRLSDIYVFSGSKLPGITIAQRFDGVVPGVFGVDIELAKVAEFLKDAEERIGRGARLFLFHQDGRLAAHADPSKVVRPARGGDDNQAAALNTIEFLADPTASAAFDAFRAAGSSPFPRKLVDVDRTPHIVRIDALPPEYGRDTFLAIAVPVHEFVAPVFKAGRDGTIFAGVFFLLFLPIVVWIAGRISRPLRVLAGEADAIRSFELAKPLKLPSHITEIVRLAQAMEAMKAALAGFTKYVPTALVRDMIASGVAPELGGGRREITLMFTDVADFTTLSEGLAPETLTRKMSTYLETVGQEILAGGGTIDKCIGDGIMAFWNAPRDDQDHVMHACLAALKARDRGSALNARWAETGEAAMRTRFGLHTGSAVVGNVGGPDRMDYTAMGAAVNLASRLEGLNKFFGTDILVSESVRNAVDRHFIFRRLGRVVPKGARTATEAFELVGTNPDWAEAPAELKATEPQVDFARRWNAAYGLYLDRKWDEAAQAFAHLEALRGEDRAAGFYAKRAETYRRASPPLDWNGVEAFDTK